MIGIEASQEVLIGFPCAARMFSSDETRDQTQSLRGAALRLEKNFFVRDELLRRGRDRPFAKDSDFRNFDYLLIRIVGLYGLNDGQ